MRSICF